MSDTGLLAGNARASVCALFETIVQAVPETSLDVVTSTA
jgi:hypothetical protein